jgi:hypothetical protein
MWKAYRNLENGANRSTKTPCITIWSVSYPSSCGTVKSRLPSIAFRKWSNNIREGN